MNRAQLIRRIIELLVALLSLSFTLVSPARGETWEVEKMQIYIEKEELSLLISLFHPYHLSLSIFVSPRVCVRPPGEKVKPGRFMVPPPGNERRDARGNSRLVHHSLFCRSGSTPTSVQVRATARQVAGSVGLTGLGYGSRLGATWRERGREPGGFLEQRLRPGRPEPQR